MMFLKSTIAVDSSPDSGTDFVDLRFAKIHFSNISFLQSAESTYSEHL